MKFLIFILIVVNSYSITLQQINNINIAYNVGKSIKAKDGTTFGYTLTGILGTETTWGIFVVGDRYERNGRLKSLYDSSLGAFQVKLSTAKLVIQKTPSLYRYRKLVNYDSTVYRKYEFHFKKSNYYLDIIKNKKWNKLKTKGDKKAIRTLSWASDRYKFHRKEVEKYRKESNKDIILINKLMTDIKFNALIGGHYLRIVYDEASRKFPKNRYEKAVGRYNGGWYNKTYYKKVIKYMKISKKYIKKH